MTQVVHEGRGQCPTLLAVLLNVPVNDTHQLASDVEDTHAVGKARVGGAWIDKVGKSKLFHPTQPLKGACLQYFPKSAFQLRVRKLHKIVHRISDALICHSDYLWSLLFTLCSHIRPKTSFFGDLGHMR